MPAHHTDSPSRYQDARLTLLVLLKGSSILWTPLSLEPRVLCFQAFRLLEVQSKVKRASGFRLGRDS